MTNTCKSCSRTFRTAQGLGLHFDHARKGHGGCRREPSKKHPKRRTTRRERALVKTARFALRMGALCDCGAFGGGHDDDCMSVEFRRALKVRG